MKDALVNIEAEAELLGALMAGHGSIDMVADLIENHDFSVSLHDRIFETILREASLGKSISPVAVKGFFQGDPDLDAVGGPSYLAKLTGSQSIGLLSCKDLAKQLRELSQRRTMRAGLSTASTACDDLTVSTSEIIDHADGAMAVHTRDAIHQPTGGECFQELFDGFKDKSPGVTSGRIRALDEVLGPLRPKQLIIAAGRPGMGKTAVALSYAIGAASQGHGVLFVSLEMSSAELAGRMAADLAFDGERGIPFSAIRDGDLTREQMRVLADAGHHMASLPFQVIDAGQLTVGRLNMLIRRHARKMRAKGQKLELVIVDYLQLMSPDTKGRSNYEAVSEVSRALKAMAKDNSVSVMALAQLSRAVETRDGKRPQLSDLRDSGQIEQDADAVMFLLRQEYYARQIEPDQTDAGYHEWRAAFEEVQGKIEFIVAKKRNGTTGTATGEFHGAYQAVR